MRFTFLFSGIVQGAWLLVDAYQLFLHVPDRFSQDELWDRTLARLGVAAESMAPVFLALGLLWLFTTIAVASGWSRLRPLATALAIGTLWYAIPGTLISLIHLFAIRTLGAPVDQE